MYTTSLDEREERRENVGEVNKQTACFSSCMHAVYVDMLYLKKNTPKLILCLVVSCFSSDALVGFFFLHGKGHEKRD